MVSTLQGMYYLLHRVAHIDWCLRFLGGAWLESCILECEDEFSHVLLGLLRLHANDGGVWPLNISYLPHTGCFYQKHLDCSHVYCQDITSNFKSVATQISPKPFHSEGLYINTDLSRRACKCYQRTESNHLNSLESDMYYGGIFPLFAMKQRLCEHQMLNT